jgi:hypothetical protein
MKTLWAAGDIDALNAAELTTHVIPSEARDLVVKLRRFTPGSLVASLLGMTVSEEPACRRRPGATRPE